MNHPIEYVTGDEAWRDRIGREWSEIAARHMHVDDGFSIVATSGGSPVGLIAVVWRDLPPPLPATVYPRGERVDGYFVALVLGTSGAT